MIFEGVSALLEIDYSVFKNESMTYSIDIITGIDLFIYLGR